MNVLLYYYYTKINNTIEYYDKHKLFCENLDLKGRIIISTEGINGTLSGSSNNCVKYMDFVKSDESFKFIEFKIDECIEHLFPKMSIKIKPYLIKLGIKNLDPNIDTGTHLSPKHFYDMMHSENVIILDTRSNYEHNIGKFKNAITLDINKFYELPDKIKEHELYLNEENRNKKILTYCTGGVRCETATTYLKQLGFQNVYQLDGGLIKYGKEQNGKDFDGKCYVFDGRITKDINIENPKKITKCIICNIENDTIINCMNSLCDKHGTMCVNCNILMNGCCSEKCKNSGKMRKKIPDYYNIMSSNKNLMIK